MEIGDGFNQVSGREIGQQLLETAIGLPSVVDLVVVLGKFVGLSVFDEVVSAPIFTQVRLVDIVSRRCWDGGEGLPLRITPGLDNFLAQMGGDDEDILGQAMGVFEDVMIDALEDVAASGPVRILELKGVGVVDVAVADGLGGEEVAYEFELVKDVIYIRKHLFLHDDTY